MCEFSEEIFNEGRKEGQAETVKDMAVQFAQMGFAIEKIAKVAGVSADTIKQWLNGETPTYNNG